VRQTEGNSTSYKYTNVLEPFDSRFLGVSFLDGPQECFATPSNVQRSLNAQNHLPTMGEVLTVSVSQATSSLSLDAELLIVNPSI